MDALVLHNRTNVSHVYSQMHFSKVVSHFSSTRIKAYESVRSAAELLKKSSCAIVGLSAAMQDCAHASSICFNDVIIQVNDHPHALKLCNRTDVRIINRHSHCRAADMPKPRLFCLRTEWSPATIEADPLVWTSTGRVTDYVNKQLKARGQRCCRSGGGAAFAFALHSCGSVNAYGLGGVGQRWYDGRPAAPGWPGIHNIQGEREWILELASRGEVGAHCM